MSPTPQIWSALPTQRQKDAEDHGTMCLYGGTMGLRHSFTCPYQGQAFLCVKKWFEAQISGILPDVFSYISHFICLYNFNYTGRPLCGPGIIGIFVDNHYHGGRCTQAPMIFFFLFLNSHKPYSSPTLISLGKKINRVTF